MNQTPMKPILLLVISMVMILSGIALLLERPPSDEDIVGQSFEESPQELEIKDLGPEDSTLSEYLLGVTYYEGKGVQQDIPKAMEHFKRASEKQHGLSALYMAHILMYETSVNGDPKEALKYLEMSVLLGELTAHYWLGIAYEFGKGVDQDLDRALSEYELACNADFIIACSRYGRVSNSWLYTKSDPVEFAEITGKTLEFIHKAKKHNDPDGIVLVALRELDYADQEFTPAEAVTDLLKVCETHKGCHCLDAALILESGFLTPQNRDRAQAYFEEYSNHECGIDSDIHKQKLKRDELFGSQEYKEIHKRALQGNKIALSEIAAYLRIRSNQDRLLLRWIHRFSMLANREDLKDLGN